MRVAPEVAGPGSYVLLLRSTRRRSLTIGRLGAMRLEPGYYAYVGSALGSGGLRARLGRHLRGADRVRWHIDYLRAQARPTEAWYVRGPGRREHLWSKGLRVIPGASIPLAGFGASDCHCDSHLFFYTRRPQLSDFLAGLLREGRWEEGLFRWRVE